MIEPTSVRQEDRYLRYIIAALLILFSILLVFLFFQYQSLRRAEFLSGRASIHAMLTAHHGVLTASDVSVIQSWMTFDYVNHLFGLPSSTLKNDLGITNVHYPHLTLAAAYAGDDIKPVAVVVGVQNAIRGYDMAHPATSTLPLASSTI